MPWIKIGWKFWKVVSANIILESRDVEVQGPFLPSFHLKHPLEGQIDLILLRSVHGLTSRRTSIESWTVRIHSVSLCVRWPAVIVHTIRCIAFYNMRCCTMYKSLTIWCMSCFWYGIDRVTKIVVVPWNSRNLPACSAWSSRESRENALKP